MIFHLILVVIITFLGMFFSAFGLSPIVTKLPSIFGFDIDTPLVQGVSEMYGYIHAIWPFEIIFQAFLFVLFYWGIKLALKFFLGSRAPGTYH